MMTSTMKYPVENSLPSSCIMGISTVSSGIHRPTMSTTRTSTHHMNNRPLTSGNPGNQWKDTSQSKPRTHASGWIDYPKHSYKPQHYHESSTKPSNRPLTAFSSDRPHKNPHRSSSIQHVSPPMPSLQDMSPSIFKIVPRRNGLDMWCMLFIIQIGCELPMNSSRRTS